MEIIDYVAPTTFEQLDEFLDCNKGFKVLGGNMWLRKSDIRIPLALDLKHLKFDLIEELEDSIKIGSMCTLRDLETSKLLKKYYNDSFKDATKHIVGVQFRNMATIGGSVASQFGFSDILTILHALNASIVLYPNEILSIEDYNFSKHQSRIITHFIIDKNIDSVVYESHRNTYNDFPLLCMSLVKTQDRLRLAIGAYPKKAKTIYFAVNDDIDEMLRQINNNYEFGSNAKASKEYRKLLAKGLLIKVLERIDNEN